ncbi:hypothetical protein [Acinetobacter baumannii]|uniref:hypothetical protein n=1 Tax=Acinetobacter baumannii TaxID=470 RepID=UPI001292CD6E|nr:hypothetical protein [Acinetobacter baumannii]MQQ81965.1 hypothetical protein [Acinetobacter baumannii]MQQ86031.1 hypothetical protein [Acinetobacter baumannii]MQR66515.1 hypothetical protein [Acinetobacter baumannii]MQR90270.1 hypothetical protein [Acinetobacter baumannii]
MDKFEEFYKQHCLDHFGYNPDLNWIFEKHEDGSYIEIEVENAKKVYQHQQSKVEELQKQLSEYIFVAETLDEMYVKEVQKSDELQEEFAEDERFLKEQIKDKDLKISNLEYQQGMDKELIQTLQCKVEKLQKQIDALEKSYFVLARIKSIASKNLLESILIKEVRQALKGEG